jgi:hypothetical protein
LVKGLQVVHGQLTAAYANISPASYQLYLIDIGPGPYSLFVNAMQLLYEPGHCRRIGAQFAIRSKYVVNFTILDQFTSM